MNLKKIVLLTLGFIVVSSVVYAADKGNPPVAHWRFDEGGGGTAYDDVGNKDGTLNAGASGTNTAAGQMWTRQGKIGGALECDGTNDYVSSNSAFAGNYDALTVTAWIKTPGTNEGAYYDRIVARWNPGFVFCVSESADGNGKLRIYLWDDAEDSKTGTTSISDNNWHHVAATWDKIGGEIRLYVDGKLDGTKSGSTVNTALNVNGTLYFSQAGNYFNGLIDDVKIYDYARTADQIMVDYNAGKAVYMGAGTDPSEGNPPVGYWKFDENTGSTAYDRSGNGNNGTITGASWVQGKHGSALNFGSATNSVDISSLNITNSQTITYWIKLTSKGTFGGILQDADFNNIISITSSCDMGVLWQDSTKNGIDVPLPLNTWIFVAIDTANKKIYINGVDHTASLVVGWGHDSVTTKLGKNNYNSFNGFLDEVKIYNYARTQAQIAYDYNKGKPIAHYKFDESGGAIAHNEYSAADTGSAPVGWWRMDNSWTDSSGNGYNGTAGGGITFLTSAKIGPYAGSFDGTDDEVSIAHNAALEPSSIAIEFWMNLTNQSKRHCLVTKWNGYTTEVDSGGTFKFGLNGCSNQYFGSKIISWGTWYHVACTFDNNTKLQCIYLNGILQESQTVTGSISYSQSGLFFSGAWDRAKGLLDDVRIYNYARTTEQIYNDYKTTHGTLVGDTKFVDGKIGKALQFDGNGDYVNLNNPSDLLITNNLTVSFWYYSTRVSARGDYQPIVSTSLSPYSSGGGWHFAMDDRFLFRVRKEDNSAYSGSEYTPKQNQWVHITGVFQAPYTYLYENGKLVDSDNIGYTSIYPQTLPVYISKSELGYFSGQVDDVRIYNYARTAEQAMQDYNVGVTAHLGAPSAGVADPWGGALPVAHWKMDENTGVLARDASGNGNNGTVAGPVWTQGKNGPCLSFDGTNDYVNMGDVLDIGLNSWTVSTWFKTSTNHFSRIVAKNATTDGWFMGTESNGNFNAGIDGVFGTSFSATYNDNQWHNMTTVWRRSSTLEVFFDGRSLGTVDISSKSGTDVQTADNLTISSRNFSSGFFNGSIDDVKVYNYVRTQAQITWDYNHGKPVAHYRFDEGSGTTAYDDSDNNNDGTITIGATGGQTTIGAAWTNGATGKFGKCMSFDGTDDGISIPVYSLSSNCSIGVWVKGSYANGNQIIIGSKDSIALGLFNSDGNKLIGYASSASVSKPVGVTGSLFINNAWNHLAVTFDGSGNPTYYCNGQVLTTSGANYWTWADDMAYIGRRTIGSYFNGLIDDVRIYNYTRTAEQVTQDYNQGLAAKLGE